MGVLGVIAGAAAAWVFGAIWYGVVGSAWMAAAGLTEKTVNRRNYVAFVGSFIAALLVAGMIRHVLATSGIDTAGKAVMTGAGLGAFVATPWIVTNYLFAQRPPALMVIDGIYATVGCTLMALMIVLL